MCGIVVLERTDGKRAAKSVLKRYTAQKWRGREGFGYIAIEQRRITNYVRARTEEEIGISMKQENTSFLMFHHRFPTSTINLPDTAHPIKVSHENLAYDYYLIHNGVINNDAELKRKHEVLGFVYSTELVQQYTTMSGETWDIAREWNDTEALAIDFALALENGRDLEARGSIAIVALQVEKTTGIIKSMFYGRNHGSPLKLNKDKVHWSLTSEGTGEDVPPNKLFQIDMLTREKSERDFTFPGYVYPVTSSHATGFRTPLPTQTGMPRGDSAQTYEEISAEIERAAEEALLLTSGNEAGASAKEWYEDEKTRLQNEMDIVEEMLIGARLEANAGTGTWANVTALQEELDGLEDEMYFIKQSLSFSK